MIEDLPLPLEERRKRAELLSGHQAHVIMQHHAAGADTDRARPGDNVAITTAIVLLAAPAILWCWLASSAGSHSLGVPCEIQRLSEGRGGAAALDDRGQVKHGERDREGSFCAYIGHLSLSSTSQRGRADGSSGITAGQAYPSAPLGGIRM